MRFTAVRVSLVLVCVLGLIGLTACGGGGSSSSGGGGGGGGTPTLNSISISPVGPAVAPNGSVTLTATGTYSDSSTKDLTSSASWSVDKTAVATVSAGKVTGVADGVATVTATSGSVSASTAVNVTSENFGNGSLPSGTSYAFFLTTIDSRGQAIIAGSFTTDGSGNITGGTADINSATTVANVAVGAGTYTVWPDGRGEATINVQGQSSHFAFVITAKDTSEHATKGKMISFDSNKSFGSFELQTAGANLSGPYVFAFNGLDASNKSMAEIGVFNTSSATGSADVNDNGTIDGGSTIPPTAPALSSVVIGSVGSGNRGVATLGSGTYAFYTIDATKAYFIQTDSSSALAGIAEKQTAIQPLSPENPISPCSGTSPAEPTCNYAFLLDRAVNAANGTFERAGQFNFCQCTIQGGINHAREDDNDGQTWTLTAGSRPFDGFGRGVIQYTVANTANPGGAPRSVIAYAISRTAGPDISTAASRMFVMNADDATPGVGATDFINMLVPSMPDSGQYTFSATEIGPANLLELGQATIDGSGNVSGIAYINNNGTLSTVAVSGAYIPSTDATNGGDGRGEIKPFNSATSSLTAYNVGSNGLILVDTSGTTPGISGRMEPLQ